MIESNDINKKENKNQGINELSTQASNRNILICNTLT